MNAERRKNVRNAIRKIVSTRIELESIMDEEDESRDNIPENLQKSDIYNESEEASDALSDAIDYLNEAIGCLEDGI